MNTLSVSSLTTNFPMDCLRKVASFLQPSKSLFAEMSRINRLVITDRARNSEYDPYFQQPFANVRLYTGVQDATQTLIRNWMQTNKLTFNSLFDTLNNYEKMTALGLSVNSARSGSLWELRRYIEKKLFAEHSDKMQTAFDAIQRRRVSAVCCSGGCTKCGSDLPLTWPTSEDRLTGKGFCSDKCFRVFNDSLRYKSRRDEPRDEMYECENRCCHSKVHWADLENSGGHSNRVWCSEKCAYYEEMDEYEDDLMYQKYDRYFDRW